MTCIIGVVKDGVVYMGADSVLTERCNVLETASASKIFHLGRYVVGFCGTMSHIQQLQYSDYDPPVTDDSDTYRFVVNCIAPRVGYKLEANDRLLIGVNRELFTIASGPFVYKVPDEVGKVGVAIGSGCEVAQGALHVTRDDTDVHRRIVNALLASEYYINTVRAPFVVVNTQTGEARTYFSDGLERRYNDEVSQF